jgi:hypothetical protein
MAWMKAHDWMILSDISAPEPATEKREFPETCYGRVQITGNGTPPRL